MLNDSLNGLMKSWGGIQSVSPSGKYYLCIRNAKESSGLEVCVIESWSYEELCRIRIDHYSAVRGLFSGFAWDKEEKNVV